MKKVLILGCSDKAEPLISRLCSDGRCVSEICLASRNKNECNEIKKRVLTGAVRIVTAGIDVTNTEGAMMMARIFGPDLIINLMPKELTENIMQLALKVGASYLDFTIDNPPYYPKDEDILGTQFKYFADFKSKGLTAVTGAGYDPAVLAACVRNANGIDFDKITSVDFIKVGKDGQPVAVEEEPEPEEEPSDVVTVYREDLLEGQDEEPEEEDDDFEDDGTGAVMIVKGAVKYVADPNPKEEEDGKSYRNVSDVILTDFIKEFPDFKNVRCLKETEPLAAKTEKKKNKREENKKLKKKQEILSALENVGLLSPDPVVIGDMEVIPLEFMKLFLPKRPKARKKKKARYPDANETPCDTIKIKGTIGGKKKACVYRLNVTDLKEVEIKTAVAAAKLMCLDKWRAPGVFTSAKFPNGDFIQALDAEGLKFESEDVTPA